MLKRLWGMILPLVKNKYLIAGVVFIVWMLFIDRNNLIVQYKMRSELNELRRESQFYRQGTVADSIELHKLTHDSLALEKAGRERYLMKRDSEDIYIIVRKPKVKK